MTNISAKLFEVFKNLKSDAVPQPARPSKTDKTKITVDDVTDEENDENVNTDEHERIKIELDDLKKGNKKQSATKESDKKDSDPGTSHVNIKAEGNVLYVMNGTNIQVGSNYYFNSSPTSQQQQQSQYCTKPAEAKIKKNNLIKLLMEAKAKPKQEHLDYIAKHLGLNYQSFFRQLGFAQGRIETILIDEAKYSIAEARYKLLLEWVRNDADGTLGRLATVLWEENEREIVKQLSLTYHKNNTQQKSNNTHQLSDCE